MSSIILTPGPGGSVIIQNDNKSLIKINTTEETIEVLGQTITLQQVAKWISDFETTCKCSISILMTQGCQCGGD